MRRALRDSKAEFPSEAAALPCMIVAGILMIGGVVVAWTLSAR
jgi:hypothetical protein